MAQFYSDPRREDHSFALPDCEVFYMPANEIRDYAASGNPENPWADGDGEPRGEGWYYWYCFPGCLPDSDPFGPFETEQEAMEHAQEEASQ